MILLRKVESYRVDTEEEAIAAIQDAKDKQSEGGYKVTKSNYMYKKKTAKGEIVDEWYVVTIQRDYCE